ncbi:hypothetical protein [Corallococcus carmarthensis]|uniref:hypothetical protein n=1 Tax=Corallococcus carmarthensis TaxID=2316728 RepID=UPI00142F17D9|nr:hypothetical protein [Corallococcus carmarthensis]
MARLVFRGLLVSTLMLFVGACHHPDAAAPNSGGGQPRIARETSAKEEAPSAAESPQAPAVVRWVLLDQGANRLRLRADIRKLAAFGTDLTVQVQSPKGVRMVDGPSSWVVPADAQQGTYSRELAFQIDVPPSEPIRLVADAQGEGFGVHATDAFDVPGGTKSRSGEIPPGGALPQPTGPALRVGDTNFGNSVPGQ